MFEKIKGKLGLTAGIIALLTVFAFGQTLVQLGDGTSSIPSLSFSYNPALGLYNAGTTQLGVAGQSIRISDGTTTFDVVATDTVDQGRSHFFNPLVAFAGNTDDRMDGNVNDDDMIVTAFYLPFRMLVGAIYTAAEFSADSGTDEKLGMAIYNNDDTGTRRASCISAEITADGTLDCDVTDVTLDAGWYRMGVCAGDVSGASFVAFTITDDEVEPIFALVPIASEGVGVVTKATNPCIASVVPTTTGALADTVTEIVPWFLGQD